MNMNKLLESIQEMILELYDKDSKDIADHIQFWDLNRREYELLYVARKRGFKTVSGVQVPSLAASESRAKQAIEMKLILRSLASSRFGREEWTQQQVTRERLMTQPPYTFKKGGFNVQVQYDNDPDNEVEYTAWQYIYYMEDQEWYKVEGEVSIDGLYYIDHDGLTVYYVSFQEEAAKYSKTGQWSLLYDNNLLKSVTSRRRSPQPSTSSEGSFNYSPSSSPVPPRGPSYSSPSPRGRRTRSRSRSRSPPRTSTPRRAHSPYPQYPQTPIRGRRQLALPAFDATGSRRATTQPGTGGGRGRGGRSTRSRTRSRSRSGGSSGGTPPSPEEVGASRQTPARGHQGRLGVLLQEARDPLGLCLVGAANTLKCLRYSFKSKKAPFLYISTTWSWTRADNTSRVGNSARMLVLFESAAQRDIFLNSESC